MKRIRWATVAACVALVALIGCRGGGQVYQVKDAPVQTASGKDLSLDEVRKRLLRQESQPAGKWHLPNQAKLSALSTFAAIKPSCLFPIPPRPIAFSTRTARTSSMTRTRKPYTKIMPAGFNDWMAPSARAWPLQEVNSDRHNTRYWMLGEDLAMSPPAQGLRCIRLAREKAP